MKDMEQMHEEMKAKMSQMMDMMSEMQEMMDVMMGKEDSEEKGVTEEEYLKMPEEKRMEHDKMQMEKKAKKMEM